MLSILIIEPTGQRLCNYYWQRKGYTVGNNKLDNNVCQLKFPVDYGHFRVMLSILITEPNGQRLCNYYCQPKGYTVWLKNNKLDNVCQLARENKLYLGEICYEVNLIILIGNNSNTFSRFIQS